jgi:hypothetical protein
MLNLRNAEWDFNLSRDWFLERFGLNVETAWFQLKSLRFCAVMDVCFKEFVRNQILDSP